MELVKPPIIDQARPFFQSAPDPWAKAMHARVNSSVYFTSGTILHLWHGDFQNRAYASRDLILKQNNFNPSKDIIKNEIGIWEWASDKPALHQSVRNYFFQRKENISEPKLPSSSSNASDSLPYAFNTADKSWGQKLFACLDQCYITFLNICGQNLKRNFPSLYYRLKKYFPDRVVEKG